jgi:hypothetical protein
VAEEKHCSRRDMLRRVDPWDFFVWPHQLMYDALELWAVAGCNVKCSDCLLNRTMLYRSVFRLLTEQDDDVIFSVQIAY